MVGIIVPVAFNQQTAVDKDLHSQYGLPHLVVDELKVLNIICEKSL